MTTCEQCIYYPKCDEYPFDESGCKDFKDKSRFVELPCTIGEKVFCILHSKREIVEDVVCDYDIWSIKKGVKLRLSLLNHNDYVVAEFGKTVFHTREEAEAALAERKAVK